MLPTFQHAVVTTGHFMRTMGSRGGGGLGGLGVVVGSRLQLQLLAR